MNCWTKDHVLVLDLTLVYCNFNPKKWSICFVGKVITSYWQRGTKIIGMNERAGRRNVALDFFRTVVFGTVSRVSVHDKRAKQGSPHVPNFIFSHKWCYFLSKERGLWCHVVWDYFYVRSETFGRVSYHGRLRCSWGILAFNSQKMCDFSCLFVDVIFFNLWLYFHHPQLLVLHVWISLQHVYTLCPNDNLLEKSEGCFFFLLWSM